ncbi:MAG TPA: permease, partial [Alphaproteobacteria bacterium]|nr:permease [Alphaproteobacteria bacterium]
MNQSISAFAVGIVFGIGLTLAQMVNPAKVLGFLDLAGDWDPSLAFVMGGGLAVAAIGYRLVWRRRQPLFAEIFQLPTRKDIDPRLVTGAALFGIGWG